MSDEDLVADEDARGGQGALQLGQRMAVDEQPVRVQAVRREEDQVRGVTFTFAVAEATAIAERFGAMAEAGLVAEVRGLATGPLSRTARQAIGYKEVLEHLEDDDEAVAEIARVLARAVLAKGLPLETKEALERLAVRVALAKSVSPAFESISIDHEGLIRKACETKRSVPDVLSTDMASLAENDKVRALVQEAVDAVNSKVARVEEINSV